MVFTSQQTLTPRKCKRYLKNYNPLICFRCKKELVLGFESRMGVFFTDFSETERNIQTIPPVNRNTLMNAIAKLRKHTLELQNDS